MQKKVLTFMLAFVLSLSFVTTASAMGYHESDIEKYIIHAQAERTASS